MIDNEVRARLAAAVAEVGGDPAVVTVETPRDPRHGDLTTNAALLLARPLHAKPLDLARGIAARVAAAPGLIAAVEVAPPGFINVRLAHDALAAELTNILAHPGEYGASASGGGLRMQVEFVSANPTGPLNVVSARAAAVGDTLVRLLRAAGFDARSEFYVNNVGRQVELLGESLAVRVRERLGLPTPPVPEEGYHGAYLTEIAAAWPEVEARALLAIPDGGAAALREEAVRRIAEGQRADLEAFRVHYDAVVEESAIHAAGLVEDTLLLLRERGCVREEEGALWLTSSRFGDSEDRVVVRADGRPTYLLPDIAYHRDKERRGFRKVIDIWGPDHHGYVPRMRAAVEALGFGAEWLEVLILQQVTLKRGGEVLKMSKRAGEFVTLRELVEEAGVDAARFFFLMRRTSSPLDFDLTLARERSEANPVYYVQYAHARIVHLLEHAAARGAVPEVRAAGLARLDTPEETALLRILAAFPRTVLGAALAREPHRMTGYLQEVAGSFHSFYHHHRVVTEDSVLTAARLALARASQIVLRRGLDLIGVSAPEAM